MTPKANDLVTLTLTLKLKIALFNVVVAGVIPRVSQIHLDFLKGKSVEA